MKNNPIYLKTRSIYIADELWEYIGKMAEKKDWSASKYVVRLIRDDRIKNHKKEKARG